MWYGEMKIHRRSDGKPGQPAKAFAVAGTAALWSSAALAQISSSLLPRNLSPWGMFLNADVVVKAVMIGLAFASLVTWTVWLAKTIELQREMRRARKRLKMIESRASLPDAVRACGSDT